MSLLPAAVRRSWAALVTRQGSRLLCSDAAARDLLGGEVLLYDVATTSGSPESEEATVSASRETITELSPKGLHASGTWGGFGLGSLRNYHSSSGLKKAQAAVQYADDAEDFSGYRGNQGGYRSSGFGFGSARRQQQGYGRRDEWRSPMRDAPRTRREDSAGPRIEVAPYDREALPQSSPEEVQQFYEENEITVVGNDIPSPALTFEQTGFPELFTKQLTKGGFEKPFPIQAQSWPLGLQGRSVVAVAKTGSGKTLGYLLPGLVECLRQKKDRRKGPTVLVLAPTRELANQIQEEAVKFGRMAGLTSVCLYGGAPKFQQMQSIRMGVDVVIATPGRLNDFLEAGQVDLRQVSFLVIDEADRMLDMGFEPQIRRIVENIPDERQTLFYTATWPKEVRSIASDLLNDPVQITIGSTDNLVANKSITQKVEIVRGGIEKRDRLQELLSERTPGQKVLVFVNTKSECEALMYDAPQDVRAATIHGDKSQQARDSTLRAFRSGRVEVLIATDVAARGIDVKDIGLVINYDFPQSVEDYVHRIGRTGRAGAEGIAHTFMTERDSNHAPALVKVMRGSDQEVPRELAAMIRPAQSRGGRQGFGQRGRSGRNFQSSRYRDGSKRWDRSMYDEYSSGR